MAAGIFPDLRPHPSMATHPRPYLLLALIAAAALPAGVRAQAFVEHITPPVVQRGKTARVSFMGKNLANSFDIWHSLPAGALKSRPVEAGSERVVFEVTASGDAPVGVCGVRVASADGLSNLHLFLVDDLPVSPGVAGESVATLAKPAAVWGTLHEGASDRYMVEVKEGERLGFEVVANRFGKDADPLVTIRDASGRFVAERDNDAGLYFDCRFEHIFQKAGTYGIEVRDARFKGNEHRQYVLRVGRFATGRAASPSAVHPGKNDIGLGAAGAPKIMFVQSPAVLPGPFFASLRRPGDDASTWVPLTTADGPVTVANENGEPTPAGFPGEFCGVLRKPGARHVFTLKFGKGQKLFLRGETRSLNSPVDLELSLLDKAGKEVRRGAESRGSDETTLEFAAGAEGEYQLVVRDALREGGDDAAYRLSARADPFPPQVVAEAEGLAVPQGDHQILPITVTRAAGTKGPINLKLLGAPPGIALAPTLIPENETSLVCKLEASPSATPGLHTIQIVAEQEESGSLSRSLVRTQPLVDRKLVNIDLIPLALREDQRRLPPSTTDRFAVLVTPPSPFKFELPEPRLTLVRYQRVPVPIVTTRLKDFDGPITFSAEGGQLAPKEEGRTRVYAEFPTAGPQTPKVEGYIQSLILSNLAKSRIKVSAVGTHRGRRVMLMRSFDLDLVAGFKVEGEPAKVSVLPGETARTRLVAGRVGPLDTAVTIRLNGNSGLDLPETLVIGKGQSGIDFEVPIPADANPRKIVIQAVASGYVNGYEEEVRGQLLEIEVRKPDVPKKTEGPKKPETPNRK